MLRLVWISIRQKIIHCTSLQQATGHEEIYRHVVSINADKITDTDADSIPSGKFICVGGTPYDLRIPRELGPAMAKTVGKGFDDNFCLTKGTEQGRTFTARVIHPHSGRVLEVYTDQPGVQFYTSNFMPDPNKNVRMPVTERRCTVLTFPI